MSGLATILPSLLLIPALVGGCSNGAWEYRAGEWHRIRDDPEAERRKEARENAEKQERDALKRQLNAHPIPQDAEWEPSRFRS